jgi:hypothetical protein
MSYAAPREEGNESFAFATHLVNTGGRALASGTVSVLTLNQNQVYYIPIVVRSRIVVRKLFVANATSVAGNVDVGLFDQAGTKVVSSGSTAQSGADAEQYFDVTDTVVGRGLYYLAVVANGVSSQVAAHAISAPFLAATGVLAQTGTFPLPATATFALIHATGALPIIGLLTSTVL